MNLSSIKKLFRINNKKKTDEIAVEGHFAAEEPIANQEYLPLNVFKSVPDDIVWHIEDLKSILTQLLLNSNRRLLDYKRFNENLIFFVEYIKEDPTVQKYINHVFSKNQKLNYKLVTDELSQTSEELSSQLKNMFFLNKRNLRVAEIMIEVTDLSTKLDEKEKRVCIEVELALHQRMMHKWSILKTSTDKQLIGKFLNEITGQKKIIKHRQKQAEMILAILRSGCDDVTMEADAQCSVGNNDDMDGSFGSTVVMELPAQPRVDASSPTAISHEGRQSFAIVANPWLSAIELSPINE